MPSEMYELSEDKCGSRTSLTQGGGGRGDCRCSLPVAFLLVLLAVLIAVGVGIIVYFASGGRQVVCECGTGTGTGTGTGSAVAELQRQCQELATAGNNVICSACPGSAMTTMMSSMSTAAPTAAPKVDVRLPRALHPESYVVELRPDLYGLDPKTFYFDGSVTIRILCRQATSNVTLHVNDLNVSDVTVTSAAGTATAPRMTGHREDKLRQFLIIELDGPLVQGGLYDVSMKFRGNLTDDLHGLYLSQYKRGNDTVYVATTQFQPTDARAAFPCFDEPAIKSNFSITLLRRASKKSLSNMPIIRTENRTDGWIADVYQTSPKMPTYLLAFIICDFDFTEQNTSRNVRYRAWAVPESVNQTRYALDVGVEILTYFEDYFQIDFPLPKQDMIAIPDFAAGAMENWGLITYRETAMLYQPGVSSEGNKERVAVVVSHELAHQWFGDLVTPSWWDDLWLNEGFASFVEYMGVDKVHPDWKMFEQFVLSDLQDVFNFDGLISSHPVYVPVGHPDEINEIFDRISYAKGASIIRMMRFFLGEETFRRGLTAYLSSRAYDAAFHDDLWFALSNQSRVEGKDLDVKAIMDTWTLQMNYPVVKVERVGSNQVRLTQARFLIDSTATDPGKYTSPFGYKWEIPFTMTHSLEKNFNVTDADVRWIRRTDTSVVMDWSGMPSPSSTSDWLLANVEQYGYYRVNYDNQNWMALINQLKTNHMVISPINRAQIINDAWNLANAGLLDTAVALGTVEYLDQELDYVPRVAATRELGFVKLMLSRSALFGSFQKFMKSKIQRPYDIIGINNTGASHLESYVRSSVVGTACEYGVEACVNNATMLYRQWMAQPSDNPVDPGLKGTVYCQAIEQGGLDEFLFAFRQYQTSQVAAEQARMLSAMSCASQPWILSMYLEWTLNTTQIRKQDALTTISYIASNPVGRSLAWDFFRTQWSVIRRDFGASFFAFTNLIGELTKGFNTNFDLEQLRQFVDTHSDLGSGARAFQQALEKTGANIRWMQRNLPVLHSWLQQYPL